MVLGLTVVCVIYGCVDDLVCCLISYSGGRVGRFGVCVCFCLVRVGLLILWFPGLMFWCIVLIRFWGRVYGVWMCCKVGF